MAKTLRKRPWLGPVLSAILLALAFAGAWPLVFVALIPWLASLREATPRQAWNRGYAFGLLFSLTQLWWLGDLAYKWTHSVFLGIVPWLVASLLTAVYYGLLGRLIRGCYGLKVLWAIPLVWAGMEIFRSYIPVLAFPWALLGEPLVDVGTFLAWFGTIYLASAFAVAVNLIPFWAGRRWVYAGALFGSAFVFFNVWALGGRAAASSKAPWVPIAVGQPGVDLAFDPDANEKIGPAVDALIREAKGEGVGVLILPEGIARGGATIPPATPFGVPKDLSLVFGGQRGLTPTYQSAFAHDAQGWTFADKTRLVIFGEFVPGRNFLPFLGAFDLPTGDLSAGNELGHVRAGGRQIGPLICFEALFPDLGLRQAWAGSQTLAVMSNDDWFALPARERLARASRWRAAEAGLPLYRAGTLGRTMIVTAEGNVVRSVPFGGLRLLKGIPMGSRGPFALVWLFPVVALGALIAVPVYGRMKREGVRIKR